MIDIAHKWDPTRGESWARMLGMVQVPMFANHRFEYASKAQEASILLDGYKGSFAFLNTEDAEFAETKTPLSWSWSSCVRHVVTILPRSKRIHVRRWDNPDIIRKYEFPKSGIGAFSLLEKLEAESEPRRLNVVRYVLEPFRQIRSRIGVDNPLLAVKFLNGLLLASEAVKKRKHTNIESIKTFNDVFKLLLKKDIKNCGLDDIEKKMLNIEARDMVRSIVCSDTYTGCQLHPALLFRHAASKLYQEAHLEIERNSQGFFPGFEPTNEPIGVSSPRDVRFTPPNLARIIVQKAFEAMPERKQNITILDPACGSGVFLVEAIRELIDNDNIRNREINLVGYDITDISEYTTRFCLNYATNIHSSNSIKTSVIKRDSLDQDWVKADVILMNPPFISWDRLTPEQQDKVTTELGETFKQRPDISMAFISKAVRSLNPGGILGCILPAALLISQSGLLWREQLSQQGSLHLLGCFEGYKYFPTSLVETAFLIYKKKNQHEHKHNEVEVLISAEGSEDVALRALRLESDAAAAIKGIELFNRPKDAFSPESWRPLRQKAYQEKDQIISLRLPKISDLFQIRQGVITGDKKLFVLNNRQYEELSRKERKFFYPVAGGGSIKNGQIYQVNYIFYPYSTDGNSLFSSEEELKDRLPNYFERYLSPAKKSLSKRTGIQSSMKWWELTRKRVWQAKLAPRLVSTFFGESGSFAFDEDGKYVVFNGHAWDWSKESVILSNNIQIPFEQTPAVWAYLAILNSKIFENIISLFSVRLQGGQLRLENRFLSQIPMPDLTDELHCPIEITDVLVDLGKAIHAGELRKEEVMSKLDKQVSLLYGI